MNWEVIIPLPGRRLFRIPRMDRFRPSWQYTVQGFFWQIHTGSPQWLVGEVRVPETKRVEYFCLDRASGVPLWAALNPPGTWWSGIEAVGEGVVLFHGFASPDLPLHKGLFAVEVLSGRTLWSNPDARFLGLHSSTVLVSVEAPGRISYRELDLFSGSVVREDAKEENPESVRAEGMQRKVSSARFPRPVREAGFDSTWPALREKMSPGVLEDSIVVLQAGPYSVVGLCTPTARHTEERPDLSSTLVVYRTDNAAVAYADVTNPHTATIVPEPFFVQDEVLYYVKQRSTLVAVRLRAA
jgi:hypothetical protein